MAKALPVRPVPEDHPPPGQRWQECQWLAVEFDYQLFEKLPIEQDVSMGWQADRSSGPGEGLPELLAGFGHDGVWHAARPSAALAAALEAVAGLDGLYEGTDTDALVGIARQWAAVESWAAAGLLGALRAMAREDSDGRPLLRRRADLPDGWDDSLNYEVAAALAMGPISAGNLAGLAWTLGTRLAGVGRLLAEGTVTKAKAKLIAQVFEPLDDGETARAEALILPEVPGKTYPQVERLAWRAALAVAPDVAERRRKAAERERARVTVFREDSGAVGLSGRDLPAAQALSGHANVLARAKEYQASGAFPGQTDRSLEALAYLHLLNGVPAADAIAFARTAAAAAPDDAGGSGDAGHAEGHGDAHRHDDSAGTGYDDEGPENDSGKPGDDGKGPGGGPGRSGSGGAGGLPIMLPEVVVPLVTLLGLAERPGENRLLGALDPALVRDLAAAAARSPDSRWEVTIVSEDGYAIGYGVARPRTNRREGSQPPGSPPYALRARVNITVTESFLRQLAAPPRAGAPPRDWGLSPRALTGAYDTWTLTLPGGRELITRFDVVPTYACDHRHEVSSYQPSERLRRLIQVRDRECTFPPCSRPAKACDFEHAIPYDQGGRTDACNAGARSRRCHQVKQLPGWKVTQQPRPGWHEWTTPTGRTYRQAPWRYIA